MLNPPRASSGPNYPALVDVLLNLTQPIDLAGETILTPDEAAQIRACGVDARAGWWRCPRLPMSVAGTLWRLRHLCDDTNPEARPAPATRNDSWIAALPKYDRRLVRRLQKAPGQHLDRRALKRALGLPAWFVDYTIGRMIVEDCITEHCGEFYPLSKAALEDMVHSPYVAPPADSGFQNFPKGNRALGSKTGHARMSQKTAKRKLHVCISENICTKRNYKP